MSRLTSDLLDLASHLLSHGPRKILSTPRRIRVILHHTVIVDSTRAAFVWEHDSYPQYYFPITDLRGCTHRDLRCIPSDDDTQAALVELTVPSRDGVKGGKTDRVVRFGDEGPLAGLLRLEFASMDQWLEEDVPIYVHPKDPYKRIDILPSTRPIQVRLGNTVIADSSYAVHLHETSLPTRYYLPLASVDPAILRASHLRTQCPYKGEAAYYHVVLGDRVYENVVWYYRTPTQESAGIAGLVCFYNEKVDLYLDGKRL